MAITLTEMNRLWRIYSEQTSTRADFIKAVIAQYPNVAADSDELSTIWRAFDVAADHLGAETPGKETS